VIVRLLLGLLFALMIAAGSGLGATWFAVTHAAAFGPIRVGAWTAWPKTGTPDIDPYARASLARNGDLPIASGDGIAFYAHTTDTGRLLDGRCEIALEGTTPAARFWTLTLYDPDGRLIVNAAGRYVFTSQEITRRADGRFAIAIAPRARAGNWLPTGGVDHIILVLRLYDTPVGAATGTGREASMPAIAESGCP
jgi:hypothetical protein